MKVFKFGNGKKNLVILPGVSLKPLAGSMNLIEHAFSKFNDEYTVYLFDRFTNPQFELTIEEMADNTIKAMNEENIASSSIYGASQGTMIALYLAIKYPERVEKLVLASPLARINDYFRSVVIKWCDLALDKKKDELINNMVSILYSKNTLDKYYDYLINSYSDIGDEELDMFYSYSKAFIGYDCYDKLNKIKIPMLVLSALGDKVTTFEGAEEVALVTNSDFYKYGEEYGHAFYDEASDFIERIYEYIEK